MICSELKSFAYSERLFCYSVSWAWASSYPEEEMGLYNMRQLRLLQRSWYFIVLRDGLLGRFENFLKILYQQWCTYNWFIMEFVIPFTTNKKHWQWVSFLSFVHHAIILLLILCKIVLKRLYNIKRIAYYILKSFFPATMSIRLD